MCMSTGGESLFRLRVQRFVLRPTTPTRATYTLWLHTPMAIQRSSEAPQSKDDSAKASPRRPSGSSLQSDAFEAPVITASGTPGPAQKWQITSPKTHPHDFRILRSSAWTTIPLGSHGGQVHFGVHGPARDRLPQDPLGYFLGCSARTP
jgi:hypothetical protein